MDTLFTKLEILNKIDTLTKKWKGKVPEKYSNEWWRYRSDQSYFLALKEKLKTNEKTK